MIRSIFILFSFTLLLNCGGGDNSKSNELPITPPPVPVIPTTPAITPEPILSAAQASRLLAQASFGATINDIEQVVEMGVEGWIDQQLSLPTSSHVDYLNSIEPLLEEDEELWREHRMETWFHHALTAPDQLRQRVAFALSEILVISDQSAFGDETLGIANYYDLLANHAFGNYRELLEQVTLSPIMGMYLSMLGNEKPDDERNIRPDENYARELMQLFSIGLVELNTDGSQRLISGKTIATYNQEIIKGFAHVYTGWNFNGTTEETWWRFYDNYEPILPMTAVAEFHDNNEKTLLNNFVVPANQSPEDDLKMALDNIFNHHNVAPFISKQLIQRLVTSNPSNSYIERISIIFNDNGEGIRGDLAAVVKAILLDDEARNGHIIAPETFGKIREPILRATHLWRAFAATTENGRFQFGWPDYFFAQAPLSAHHVFNFFSPNYSPPGNLSISGLVAPELEITTENYITRTTNFIAYSTLWGNTSNEDIDREENRILINLEPLFPLIDDAVALIAHLDLLLMAGTMSEEMKIILTDSYNQIIDWDDHDKISNLIFLIMASPQYAVQR
ncbi:MAG: DUF1800 domain-containing protein [Colwellia sp.]|nr:DUF1800 domain-containing protein [Colwellia sp.]